MLVVIIVKDFGFIVKVMVYFFMTKMRFRDRD